ncbi:alpha/beta-Hydrolases superfamily protein [Zea mays]|uniref:Alpha/beta-Hydrolases superfamily protein n=1 Tax=Zea mays TaxID=4577 RepID=A0A1D6KNM3_MAIZE|nr:alpha/beta-Hydrolases superfamily protein [Zea mays]
MIAAGAASMGRAATPAPGAQSSRLPRAVSRLRLVLRSSEAAARSGSKRWIGCFRPSPSPATAAAGAAVVKEAKGKRPEVEVEPARGGGEDVWSADAETEVAQGGAFPEHLVIMVNGLVGSADDWKFAAEQFVRRMPDKVIVHQTWDIVCVTRRSDPPHGVTSVLTYLLGDSDIHRKQNLTERIGDEVTISLYDDLAKIKGSCHHPLLAQYFTERIAAATTAAGSQCNSATQTFDGVDLMGERLANEVLSVVEQRRGVKKISFVAHSLGGLVARYAIGRLYEPNSRRKSSGGESRDDVVHLNGHIAGLEPMNFITFASPHLGSSGNKQLTKQTDMVGWRTSSIRRQHELPKHRLLVRDEKYPHIVYVEKEVTDNNETKAHADHYDPEEEMIRGLTQVPWERVDVSFQKSTQRLVAHNTIQVKSYWLNSDGADVINHMMDNFIV